MDKRAVAAAAARAGLQFAIFSDHGDGTRPADPPEYIDGVLCLDGVEISTNGGHYVAIGMATAAYPLGGEADAVAEDVARLGGFGVAAHPSSPRPELAWSDWRVPVDGIEWLNSDSEWRDEGRLRLSRAFFDYLWRPAGALASLLDRPATLSAWDRLTASRRVVALAGHDAHGGLGEEPAGSRGRRVHIPSYEAAFRTFSLNVTPGRSFTSDASADAAALLEAIREGRLFTALDAVAAPASFDFTAHTADGTTAVAGGELPAATGEARFAVRASVPAGAGIVLLRNGGAIAEQSGGLLEHRASLPGAYRVEVHVPGAPGDPPVPWIVSNPIYRLATAREEVADAPFAAASPVSMTEGWRIEASPGSSGRVSAGDGGVTIAYQLQPDVRTSQFVAAATDVGGRVEQAEVIQVRAAAPQPMRVSVQLRFDEGRWVRSIYLDPTPRQIRIPLDGLRPAGTAGPLPPLSRLQSVLFVVDLTNAAPGASGSFTLREVAFGRLSNR
jgi:hypothetical protein